MVTGDQKNTTKDTASEDNEHNIDDDFWSEVLSAENSGQDEEFCGGVEAGRRQETVDCSEIFEGKNFWYNLLARAESTELLDLSPENIF